ncbi:MAG: cupin domain-containing protein [Geitlerinemataceae cyanobacterium]
MLKLENMERIEKIFDPVNLDDFQGKYFNKKALFVPGHECKFSHVMNWENLNTVLDNSILPDVNLILVKKSQHEECRSISELRSRLNDGYTLVLNNLHRKFKPVGILAEEIGRYFNEPTQVNLYLSQSDVNGFDMHYDTHDVLIFQLYGSKHWDIYHPTVEKPVFIMKEHGKDKPTTAPYADLTLTPGDLLYIPRGHWHLPISSGNEPSLHLTLGVRSRTGLDFLEWLKGELSESLSWRESFTFCRDTYIQTLKEDLINIISSNDTFDRYNDYCFMNLWTVNDLSLPYSFLETDKSNLRNETIYISSLLPVIIRSEHDRLIILFKSKKITLSKKVELLINYLLGGNSIQMNYLYRYNFNLTDDEVYAIVSMLFSQGLISVRRDLT